MSGQAPLRMTQNDLAAIEQVLDVLGQDPVTVVELGTHRGGTARWLHGQLGDRIRYFGVENLSESGATEEPPFDGADLILGCTDDLTVLGRIPPEIHLLLVDACHCPHHVILDFVIYGSRIPPGGVVIFHDTEKSRQGLDQGYQCIMGGSRLGVLKGMDLLGIGSDPRWELIVESSGVYGVTAYRRV